VNYSTTKGGIVLRRNVLPPSVPENYNPWATPDSPPPPLVPWQREAGGAGAETAGAAAAAVALAELKPETEIPQVDDEAVPLATVAAPGSLEDKLSALKELHAGGYISTEAYAARQVAVLVASGL
jgi:hypothetical protein